MINCDICQVANDDALLFCKDCGGRLKRPTPAPAVDISPAPVVQAPQAPKPKLRSPILGGGSDEDFEDEPVRPAGKGKTKSSKGLRSPMLGGGGDDDFDEPEEHPVKRGKGGLRSPMLGGASGDDDSDEPEEPSPKRGKGGLRSPILGSSGDEPQAKPKGRSKGGLRSPILGGAADLDDDDDDDDYQPAPKGRGLRSPILGGGDKHAKHDIEFPHRHTDLPAPEEHENTGRPGKSRGLRSPLLGGDDGDFEEMPSIEAARPHGTSQSGRLRSPILGGGGDYIDDEYEEEDEAKPDDPTALRSPLLAVRAPRAEKPKAEAKAPAQPHQPPAVQQIQQPAPVHQPAPVPQAPLPSPTATGNSFTSFDPSASQTQMAAMPAPNQAPRYQPQPAPKPTNTNYNLGTPGQTLVNLDPAPAHNFNAPPAVPPNPPAAPPAPAAPAKPAAPQADNQDTGRKLGRSRLLGDSSAAGDDEEDDFSTPKDRRGRPDRRIGQRSGRRSLDIDSTDNDDDLATPDFPARPQAANPMAPLVMALVGLALLGKIWYVMTFGLSFLQSQPQVIADQLFTAILIIGAMMMALKK